MRLKIIGDRRSHVGQCVEWVADGIGNAERLLVVSKGRHGLLMSMLMKFLEQRHVPFEKTARNMIHSGSSTVEFMNFSDASKLKPDADTVVYACELDWKWRGMAYRRMMDFFSGWRKWKGFFATVDCSRIWDEVIDKVVAINDGGFELEEFEEPQGHAMGDFSICRRCGKCIGLNMQRYSSISSRYDVALSIQHGIVAKNKNDNSIYIPDEIGASFDNAPESLSLYVDRDCPFYMEHYMHGLEKKENN